MIRDLDLIRVLMLHLEQATTFVTDRDAIDGYSRDKVAYHLALIIESGFAEGQPLYGNTGSDPTIPGAVVVMRLTSAGHDYIDSIRDAGVWSEVKQRIVAIGGTIALQIVSQIAQSVLRKRMGLG